MMFTEEDINTKEIVFRGVTYQVGCCAYKRSELNGNFFKTFTLRNGQIYAYNKINKMVFRTY